MSFTKSLINQLGRDAGKVISNQVFKDAHSSPYRRTNSIKKNTLKETSNSKFDVSTNLSTDYYVTEFNKAMNFQFGHRPSTLISKLNNLYIIIKNSATDYMSDDQLDYEEFSNLLEFVQGFNQKSTSIYEILSIDEETNEKEINQLSTIVKKCQATLKETFQKAYNIEHKNSEEYYRLAEGVDVTENTPSALKYIFMATFFLGPLAKKGKINWFLFVIGNGFIVSLKAWWLYIIVAIYSIIRYFTLIQKQEDHSKKERFISLGKEHEKRAEIFQEVLIS